jgi:DNA-binding beta-propeller fold protein YncE
MLRLDALLLLLAWPSRVQSRDMIQYLLVSHPHLQTISYIKVPDDPYDATFVPESIDLITEGLQDPRGIAVDPKTNRLFVADEMQQKVLYFELAVKDNKLIPTGDPVTVAQDTKPRWVAVDGVGNAFFTNGAENKIERVLAERMELGDSRPELVYNASLTYQVSKPAGIAVDNFNIYWANREQGIKNGALAMGLEQPPDTEPWTSVRTLSDNVLISFGVCLSATNVYYTTSSQTVYGTKKVGGPVVKITDKLNQPKGCVWDNDGTIYVADRGNDGIYTFPGSSPELHAQRLKKFSTATAPWGLAMIAFPRSGTTSLALYLVFIITLSRVCDAIGFL